jgi:hypothetical protein
MQLAEAIQQLAGTKFMNPTMTVMAEVVSVDAAARTCVCTAISGTTTADIPEVHLMAETEDGLLLVPEIGSSVIVAYNNELIPFVVMYSGIESATFWVNGVITLKDGTLGGIPIVGALLQKINALENKVNQLLQAYNAHVHTDPVSGSTGTPSIPVAGTLTPTQLVDIENKNVTHG